MIQEFYSVSTIEEALRMKEQKGRSCAFLAGGTEILRKGSRLSPNEVIGLDIPELRMIGEDDSHIAIGAGMTLQRLIDEPIVPDYVRAAASMAGSRTLRNMATIGGNIISNRYDSYLLPTLLAAKARIITADISENDEINMESIPIREFFEHHDLFENCLVVRILIKKRPRYIETGRFSKTKQSPPSLVVAFGAIVDDQGVMKDPRIIAGVSGSVESGGIQRLEELESLLVSEKRVSQEDVMHAVHQGLSAEDDLTGSAEYKRYLAGVTIAGMYERALLERMVR